MLDRPPDDHGQSPHERTPPHTETWGQWETLRLCPSERYQHNTHTHTQTHTQTHTHTHTHIHIHIHIHTHTYTYSHTPCPTASGELGRKNHSSFGPKPW